MSVALAGTPTTGVFTSGTGLSVTPGAGSNRAVVLALAHSSSSGNGLPNYTGVQPTYNGVNLTQAGSFIVNSTARYMACSVWYILEANLPGSAQTLNATWTDATNHLNEADGSATIYTLTGVNQTTPVSGTDSGTSNSATSIAGTGLSATTGGMVVVNCSFNAASNTGVNPSGYTQDFVNNFDFSGYAMQSHKAIGSAGTETPSVSWTGAGSAAILTVNFQQAVSSTVVTPPVGSVIATGSASTVTPANNTVIQTFVARHSRILAPKRTIFLPSRKVA